MKNVIDKISQVGRNAAVIAATSLVSRLLGIFRDRVLASEFGAGSVLDSYYAAFRIPDFVFNLIILGALSAALIPIFSSLLFKNKEKAWQVVNNFASISFVFMAAVLLVLFFATPWLVKIMAPGFEKEAFAMTVSMTRVMLLSPIFFALSSIVGGVLNSFGRFFAYSIAPIIYNIGIICGALYLVPTFGPAGLAWGVIAGAAGHLLIQLPTFFSSGFRFRPSFNLKDPYFKKILILMLPVTLGLALMQINLFVDSFFGSLLEEGSIAIINFSTNIVSLPVGLVGISVAVSIFPLLAYAYTEKKEALFSFHFTGAFNLMVYLLIPAMVFTVLFRAYIVRLLLGAGLFDVSDTVWTSRALGYLSLSIVAQGMIPFLVRAFYAIGDTKTPVKITFVAVFINILCSIIFTMIIPFRVVGLALAASIAAFVNFFFLLLAIRKRFGHIDFVAILGPTGKYMLFSLAAGFVAYRTLYWVEPYIDTAMTLGLFLQTMIAGLAAVAIYIILSIIFKVPEAERLVSGARRALRVVRR
ncbi:murein biosynthesis integral membrane protein MurJ [Candidatus Microgenomates bacterium]|nr:murein biosynthesis integral membrane protein MurJ [Candidatus Microgenomates bacterium]